MQIQRLHVSLLAFIFSLTIIPTSGISGVIQGDSAGFRLGTSINGEGIQQNDIFIARKLPWNWRLSSGWNIDSLGELSVSALHQNREDGLSASFSTDFILSSPQHKVSYFAGVGVGAMEDYVLGDFDFGGPIFFLSHVGFSLPLLSNLSLALRCAHQSNGHIYNKNPSLNLGQIELRLSF